MKEEVEVCPECGNSNFSYDLTRGEWCCECGLIIRDKELDQTGGVKRKYGEPKYPVGAITYYGIPGGYIDHKNLDFRGNKIPSHTQPVINRMRKWHSCLLGPEKHRINVAMDRLHSLLSQLNVEWPVKLESAVILYKALKKLPTQGRSFEHLAAAVIYIAYRVKEIPKTIEEISEITSISKKTINRYCKLLLNVLDIKIAPLDPLKYIPGISEKLAISGRSQILAGQLLKTAEEGGLALGKKPTGLVAAALYLACKQYGEKITQRELAKAANVTEVTLRTRYKEFKKILEALKSE
ncbi:MAG: hypothetical protein IB617_02640 [Candidatus Nealsonbacteria bacterium]|nr:MAG: hypothetical protein IB617_02640 [Candidatus Nealsonbacteria bacterium]